MTKEQLITKIKTRVYDNASSEITGQRLQDTLIDIVNQCYGSGEGNENTEDGLEIQFFDNRNSAQQESFNQDNLIAFFPFEEEQSDEPIAV